MSGFSDPDKTRDFSSNDYLGLSQNSRISQAIINATIRYGVGSTGSRLLSGDHSLFHQLESDITTWIGKPSALFFNTGYQMNVGLLSALAKKGDGIFMDRLSHASLVDGAQLSQAKFHRFRHNDLDHLTALLQRYRSMYRRVWIVTESVFSMEADLAPLAKLITIKQTHDAQLFVDEAHAIGLYSRNGAGLVSELGITDEVDVLVGTFGKAMGVCGAFVACNPEQKEHLINTCRSFIYTTALPLPIAAGVIESIAVIQELTDLRKQVLQNANSLRAQLAAKGFKVPGNSQIVPVILGSTDITIKVAAQLADKQFRVLPIRPPTVPEGKARLRLSITANHSRKILDNLATSIEGIANPNG